MKVKHYDQMMAWLTRPGFKDGGRIGYKLGGNEIIAAYNKAAKLAGGNPSIEQVRAATGGKPVLERVRKILNQAGLTLGKPRGGFKEEVLKVHAELKEKLGKNPTTEQIDEKITLSKIKDPNQRKSQIKEYLKQEKLEVSESVKVRSPEARTKAAETLKAKEFPRKGQPRKTPEAKRLDEIEKRKADIKRDPQRIKRQIQQKQTGTKMDVHHMYPKSESESLRRLMPLHRDINRKAIKGPEDARDKLMRRPIKDQRTLSEINALQKKLRRDLRKVPGAKGALAFPIKDESGNVVKWIGKNEMKSYAGRDKGKLLDIDFNIEDPKLKDKIVKEALKKKGPGIGSKIFGAALGPSAIVGLTAGLGVDPKSGLDRAALGAEAAFAPSLVKGTEVVSKGIQNPTARKGVEMLLNAGMKLPMALRVARMVSPIGWATLGAEGIYQAGKREMARREQMSPEELEDFHLERQSRGWSRMREAGGGIVNIRRPGAVPPESGPMPHGGGLSYRFNRVKKLTE